MQRHQAEMEAHHVEAKMRNAMRQEFPGSQPVSLAQDNHHLLTKHRCATHQQLSLVQRLVCPRTGGDESARCRYWFTWKADGTRYMLYITSSGTYLVDRRFSITRVQMRFPAFKRDGVSTATTEQMAQWLTCFDSGRLPRQRRISASATEFHHCTVLDGEMVVNEDGAGRQERVFYAYDLMMLHGVNVAARPWKVRPLGY